MAGPSHRQLGAPAISIAAAPRPRLINDGTPAVLSEDERIDALRVRLIVSANANDISQGKATPDFSLS